MPGGDGTGPAGMGPMTGRAAGYCAGYAVAGFMNPSMGGFGGRGYGWGRGWGRGFGWGRGRRFAGAAAYGVPYTAPYAPYPVAPAGPTREQQADVLKGQAEYLEDALEGVRKRLAELEAKQEEKS